MLQWVGSSCKDSCHLQKPTEKHRSNASFLEYIFDSQCEFKGGEAFRNLSYRLRGDYFIDTGIGSTLIFNQSSDF